MSPSTSTSITADSLCQRLLGANCKTLAQNMQCNVREEQLAQGLATALTPPVNNPQYNEAFLNKFAEIVLKTKKLLDSSAIHLATKGFVVYQNVLDVTERQYWQLNFTQKEANTGLWISTASLTKPHRPNVMLDTQFGEQNLCGVEIALFIPRKYLDKVLSGGKVKDQDRTFKLELRESSFAIGGLEEFATWEFSKNQLFAHGQAKGEDRKKYTPQIGLASSGAGYQTPITNLDLQTVRAAFNELARAFPSNPTLFSERHQFDDDY